MSDVKEKIEALNKEKPVMVYMKGTPEFPACGFSARALEALKAAGLQRDQMHSFDVLMDESIRQGIKEYSNWPTIPQVYVNGDFVGGCDIICEMYEKGELQQLVESLK